ncbi:hypothetical protein Glove_668g10 [Diversispora epigaea]|uniref:Uncharacterized protein n=1 Tax=Diversispora epigaea TaxID=1348612 RepID=A0A397G715_9GLOM|nr:hypothetical protein Glove_668g10 [Diversispora epigaea]
MVVRTQPIKLHAYCPKQPPTFPANQNLNVNSIVPRPDRPFRVPYTGHLDVGNNINAIQWYNTRWNEYLVLGYCHNSSHTQTSTQRNIIETKA